LSRRSHRRSMDGLLLVDKPSGPTSHDVVARVRRALGERRIGHTGTLDPMASGVLPLVLGRATRLARFLSASDKTYDAVIRLGVATDTHDAEGVPTGLRHEGPMPSRAEIDGALEAFRGTFLQQPPRYSAKRIGGRRSYDIARARAAAPVATTEAPDAAADPLPSAVTVRTSSVEIVNAVGADVTLRVECSAGFYVRSLAHDLGERLGIGAHLTGLRRTRCADFTLERALTLQRIEQDRASAIEALIPPAQMLSRLSAVVLTSDGVRHAGFGRDLGPPDFLERSEAGVHPWLRLLDAAGELIGLAEPARTPGLLHPSVILG
jgi:tRNA pseudouridine55 synthase